MQMIKIAAIANHSAEVALDAELAKPMRKLAKFTTTPPNIPADVPVGAAEDDNVEVLCVKGTPRRIWLRAKLTGIGTLVSLTGNAATVTGARSSSTKDLELA